MARRLISRRTGYRVLFLALALVLMLMRLLPLQASPVRLPGPELMLCFTLAWLLRRPSYLPPALIVAVFFFEDMVLMRPPGLWTLAVLLGTEFLRTRETMMRESGFLFEWFMVAAVVAAMLLFDRLGYMLAFLDQPAMSLTVMQYLATIVAYPAVVAVTSFGFGLRRAVPGERDGFGRPM